MEHTLWLNQWRRDRKPSRLKSLLHRELHRLFHKVVRYLDRNSKHIGHRAAMSKSSWKPFLSLYCHTSYSGMIYLWVGACHHNWLFTVVVDRATGWGEYIRFTHSHTVWGVYADIWKRRNAEERAELRKERRE